MGAAGILLYAPDIFIANFMPTPVPFFMFGLSRRKNRKSGSGEAI